MSEIAPEPGEARILPVCRHFLKNLSEKTALVAVVSGRAAHVVKDMVGLDNLVYIGSHGMERWMDGHSEFVAGLEKYPELIESTISEIKPYLNIDGIKIEDKKVTASIHYRRASDPRTARETIIDALNRAPHAKGLRIMQNKMIIELLPPADFNKGTAVTALIREHRLSSAIYIGDDVTDIDAFKAMHKATGAGFTGLAIAVTGPDMPAELTTEVDYTLNGVNDVARFLEEISNKL